MKVLISNIPDISILNENEKKDNLSQDLISVVSPVVNSKLIELKSDIVNLDKQCNDYDLKIEEESKKIKDEVSKIKHEKFKNDTLLKLKEVLNNKKINKNEVLFIIDMLDKLSASMITKYIEKLFN